MSKDKKIDINKAMQAVNSPLAQLELIAFAMLSVQALEAVVGDILEEAQLCSKQELSKRVAKAIQDVQEGLLKGLKPEQEPTKADKDKKEAEDLLKLLGDLPDDAFGKVQ